MVNVMCSLMAVFWLSIERSVFSTLSSLWNHVFFLQNCSIGESRSSNQTSGSNDGAKGRASGLYVWARIFNLIFFLLQHFIYHRPQQTLKASTMPQRDRLCRLA